MGEDPDDKHWTERHAIDEDADVPDALKELGSRENLMKNEIESVIRRFSRSEDVFCTVREIANALDVSPQTVRNHIDEVVGENTGIRTRKAGQTPVYYYTEDLSHELDADDDVVRVVTLDTRSMARYAQVKEAPSDSEFDLHVYWFDPDLNRICDYVPSPEEVGLVTPLNTPVSVKYAHHSDYGDMEGEEDTTNMVEMYQAAESSE